MTEYAIDLAKFEYSPDQACIDNIVKYCGIAVLRYCGIAVLHDAVVKTLHSYQALIRLN
ncbi:MAG: hypothetical protein ACJA0Z_003989 [Halioglobus sp.]|jgi:hypothetical protein